MRFLLCLCVVLFGCVASLPEDHTLSADIACETARMVTQMRHEIAPTPVSDECENCDGTGKIGDPSFKDEARKLMTDEVIAGNVASIKRIFERFLTFGDGPTDAVMVGPAAVVVPETV